MIAPAEPAPEISEARRRKIEKRVSTARLIVNSYCRFFAHLVGKTTVVIAEPWQKVPTACVTPDGYIYVNPDYVERLSDPELAGLMIHETLHPALMCWKRRNNRTQMIGIPVPPYTCSKCKGQDPNCKHIEWISAWNLAHDLSFNPDIVELANNCRSKGKIKLPKHAALIPDYEGKAAEEIYDLLLDKAKPSEDGEGPAGNVGVIGRGAGKAGDPNEAGDVFAGMGGDSAIGDDLRDDLCGTPTGKAAVAGDKSAQNKLANDWKRNVIAAAMAHEKKHGQGSLPLGISKLVRELQEHKVEWRDVLSQWVGENGNRQDITWRRPRRRFDPNSLYLPSFQKFGVDDVAVLWDTSGSMNGRETEILSEINSICEDLGLSLVIICIDAVVQSVTRDVTNAIDVIPHIKGGGGSNFIPAFDLLEEEGFEGVVVAFTDGWISVPKAKPPQIRDCLWCIKPTKEGGFGDVDPTEKAGGSRWGQVLLMDDMGGTVQDAA